MDKIDGEDGSTLVTFTHHLGPPARELDRATSGADSTGSR